MDDDERARYWAVLNGLREGAVGAYAESVEVMARTTVRSLHLTGRVFCGLGVVFVVLTALIAVTGEVNIGPIFVGLVCGSLALFLLVGGAVVVRQARSRELAQADWEADEPQRRRRQATLSAVAATWDGHLTHDGIASNARWLSRYWPHRAPTTLLLPYTCHGEERTTLTATVDGHPVLVQLIELWPPTPQLHPPLWAVLVASPLAHDVIGRDPRETPAGRRLVDDGFQVVAWNPAGAYALYRHDPGLEEPDGLPRSVGALVDLCRDAAGTELPPSTPSDLPGLSDLSGLPGLSDLPGLEPGADTQEVADAFLQALTARAALAALACADLLLFPALFTEPTPLDLDETIDAAGARPVACGPTRLRIRASVGICDRTADIRLANGRKAHAAIYLCQTGDRWRVRGYKVGTHQVLGFDYPD